VLSAIGARVIDRELPIGLADDAFHEHGGLADEDQALALAGILAELAGDVASRGVTPARAAA
jgi:chromate reductase, NAD(P)H dehydrogenase (quinone)